jgi:DNA-binding XRE family transcriptional regulator
MTEFGLDCFVYRAKNRLTQKEMGQLCGVDRTLIIDIEKGRPVSKMTETKVRLVLEEDKR